jgi:putative sterol carrier protein
MWIGFLDRARSERDCAALHKTRRWKDTMADTVAGFFSELQSKVDPAKIAGMNATYQFAISGEGGGDWYVKIADGAAQVVSGTAEAPSITLTASAEDWLKIVSGQLSGQTAFLTGKLKIKGDMSLAMKLQSVFAL